VFKACQTQGEGSIIYNAETKIEALQLTYWCTKNCQKHIKNEKVTAPKVERTQKKNHQTKPVFNHPKNSLYVVIRV
jgi:Zn finger protein HypA/HybF involved in hydrogenase expression